MDTQFYELLTSTVTGNRRLSTDSFGNNTYDTDVFFSARIDSDTDSRGSGAVQNEAPNNPSSDYRLITDYISVPFVVRDKMTLPTGEVTYVRSVETVYDDVGPHHVVISVSTEDES